ncbi:MULTISPECIES: hypothetical protein [Bradyrhizobium]|uniref:hypothetical protein n=1 Tax=Bradyrhizobium TaxID=374 RepID=UPI0013E8A145|nr:MULTISPECIES: hypothetical protein [Bradyrhizobium]UQR68263.1 hypothetical protein LRP30_36655 [Bradyrhizobium sp. C-145]
MLDPVLEGGFDEPARHAIAVQAGGDGFDPIEVNASVATPSPRPRPRLQGKE